MTDDIRYGHFKRFATDEKLARRLPMAVVVLTRGAAILPGANGPPGDLFNDLSDAAACCFLHVLFDELSRRMMMRHHV